MKVYLDSCCFGRPYDDQNQERISKEATAKLTIQKKISNNEIVMISSEFLLSENMKRREIIIRDNIQEFILNFHQTS